jgi:HAD superfamily hydrolase (TIGR01490 family)
MTRIIHPQPLSFQREGLLMNSTSSAPDAAPITSQPPERGLRPAAFFGLDRTLIPGSSLMALAQGLYQRDFYRRYDILRFAYRRFIFRFRRSEATPHFESSTREALDFVAGHAQADMRALAEEIAGARIMPIVYRDMAMLIDQHRMDGTVTYVTTAAPVELAEIVADGLGMTGALGTRAEIDDLGRYTGRLTGSILQGEAKASAVAVHMKGFGSRAAR